MYIYSDYIYSPTHTLSYTVAFSVLYVQNCIHILHIHIPVMHSYYGYLRIFTIMSFTVGLTDLLLFAIFEIPHVWSQNTKICIIFSSFSFQKVTDSLIQPTLLIVHHTPTNSIIYPSTYSQLHFSLSSTPFSYIPSYPL